MVTARKLSLTALIVGLAMVLGGAARMYKLADRSVNDVEMYTPGIPLRADISVPGPRLDFAHVLGSDLFYDTHPPGYYLTMFFVTRVFGASTLAIRLPSVLFGVASIGLVYWLGLLIGQRVPGCIAALLLAFNGYHMVHSQQARSYAMVCFIGLLATILLILLSQQKIRRRFLEFCYGAVMLFGLASHHYFWAILATHMVWVLANAWVQERPLPRLLSIQILVMILGSPLLAVAKLQSLNEVATLSAKIPVMAREYVQFYWIFPGFNEVLTGKTINDLLSPTVTLVFRVLLCLFCFWLFVVGFRRLNPVDDPTLSAPAKPFIGLWILAAVLATLADVGLIFATSQEIAHSQGVWIHILRGVEVLAVLPSILFMVAIALVQSWQPLCAFGLRLHPHVLAGGQRLVLLLTIMPFAMFAVASILARPLLAARGLLFVAPYLLFTLACGIFAIGRRSRSLAIVLFLVLATLHAYSLSLYSDRFVQGGDFKAFAAQLQPQIRPGDLVFLRKDWDVTPILFYLRPDQYKFHASGFSEAVEHDPSARVWVVLIHGEEPMAPDGQALDQSHAAKVFDEKWSRAVGQALQGYHAVETIDVHWARAVLYCNGNCQ